MNRFRLAYGLLRQMEPRLLGLRAMVMLRKRLGFEQRVFKPRPWDTLSLSYMMRGGTPSEPLAYARYKRDNPPPFLFPLGYPPEIALPAQGGRELALPQRLELLAQDRCIYFFEQPSPGPVAWHDNALDGKRVADPSRSWFEIPDFTPEQGDMRSLWEPARGAWAFDLARARARGWSADELALLYWRWADSWMVSSPPFRGIHWKCGQESAVRFIAHAFAFWALDDAPAAKGDAIAVRRDAQRWLQLARLAWATGFRIAHHIQYAVSQKNNHALSEACGLLLVTQLFPELEHASAWRALGRRVLEQELARQVYADGSYVQHSLNYQRVMLQVATLALRLTELAGDRLGAKSYQSVRRASLFLFQLTEASSGWTPLYGNDDGALVLPLSECHYRDFRPAIQAAHAVSAGRPLLEAGPWDEEAMWLLGGEWVAQQNTSVEQRVSSAFEAGGYYTLRRPHSWAMIRCHHYRDRPAHYDPLHVDLWWRGQNVLRDRGSYRYYDPAQPSLEHYFKSAGAHNVLTLDEGEPIELVSRFLWLPWPRARAVSRALSSWPPADGARTPAVAEHFAGENLDYDRAPWRVKHRRTLLALEGDVWLVIDDLQGQGAQRVVLRWQLPDIPMSQHGDSLCLQTVAGCYWLAVEADRGVLQRNAVLRGTLDQQRAHGFEAPHYGAVQPAPTLEVVWQVALPCRVVSLAAPERPTVSPLARAEEALSGEMPWKSS